MDFGKLSKTKHIKIYLFFTNKRFKDREYNLFSKDSQGCGMFLTVFVYLEYILLWMIVKQISKQLRKLKKYAKTILRTEIWHT